MNLYNVMVYYRGEGDLNIHIPVIGDVKVYSDRPIYLKNATFNVIEALRQFRSLMIDIKINAGPEGAYKIYDYETYNAPIKQIRPRKEIEQVTDADIQSILGKATNGPIVLDEPVKEVKVETKEVEETVENSFGNYVLPSGKYEGKTLAEVDKEGKLESIYNGFKSRNKEVKEAIENYYNPKK